MSPPQERTAADAAPAAALPRRTRTLLVEPANAPQALLRRLLQERGHDATVARDAAAGLAAFVAEPFDLAFLPGDRADPHLETLWRSLRALPGGPWCHLVVLTAGNRPWDIETALHTGADDYLAPTEDERLLGLRLAIAERRVAEHRARRRMMDDLSESEARFRDLLETAPDAILRIGSEGRICLMNEQAERLTGYARAELLGQPIEVLVPEPLRAPHVEHRRRFFQQPVTRPMGSALRLVMRCKDGREMPVDICLGHHRSGGHPYAICAIRDVTERRRLEEELRLAKEAAERAYERIRRDLQAAARVQRALLPAAIPAVEHLTFAWEYLPCAELAGDGLNVFRLDEDHVGLYLLDVSGHGVAAALLSVSLARLLSPLTDQSTLLRVPQADGPGHRLVPPVEVACRLNRWLLADPTGEQYFTIVYGILDLRSLRFRYVCAGHPGPIRLPAAGAPEPHSVPSYPIGLFEGADFEEQEFALRPGDRVFLHSDGVTDAFSPEGQRYGPARLHDSIARHRSKSLQTAVAAILDEVRTWSADAPHDDVSILAFAVE
jgi:sigma-B regulation protein RsbU (phosphoserine phosphatase)